MMRIGIYGGTFNPPHLGHREAARAAMEHLNLDRLLLVPSRTPPHKVLPRESADGAARMAMTALMADSLDPRAEASPVEFLREGPSYTVDTVKALRAQYPDGDFYLLMGTDMFLSFGKWKDAVALAKEVTLAPFSREEGDDQEHLVRQEEYLAQTLEARVRMIPLPQRYPISSSEIRSLLGSAETVEEGGSHLWGAVYGYILTQGLYGVKADLRRLSNPQLRAVVCSMMQAKRIPHVLGTEETAAALAEHWGVNVALARRAAILHDCTKYWSLSKHLALCEDYHIPLTALERGSEKLLHAKTAAILAEHRFGEGPEVCAAIDCHTTGKPDMTTLDKVLYLADYIEPNRNFPGVEELRRLSWENLDQAMCAGIETTIRELVEKRAPIHDNTAMTLAQLKGT